MTTSPMELRRIVDQEITFVKAVLAGVPRLKQNQIGHRNVASRVRSTVVFCANPSASDWSEKVKIAALKSCCRSIRGQRKTRMSCRENGFLSKCGSVKKEHVDGGDPPGFELRLPVTSPRRSSRSASCESSVTVSR
jgi:hypothetical protein